MYTSKQITHSPLLIICILLSCLCHIAQAKSVYVITDGAGTVKAYDIQGDQIEEQKSAENLQRPSAVGLALDPDSETLFVTYEGSNIIEMLNAKTMISEENPVVVPNASNLAGIAIYEDEKYLNKTLNFGIMNNNNKLEGDKL